MSDTDVLDMAADPEERAALQALARRLEHAAGTDLAPLPPDLRARRWPRWNGPRLPIGPRRPPRPRGPPNAHAYPVGCVPARCSAARALRLP